MRIRVLLNPYSNRWNAQARWPEAETALGAAGIQFEFARAKQAGHLSKLAAEAVGDGCDVLVVAGGDGSIGEVVNGAARGWQPGAAFPATLGILPLGTANDVADNIGLPRDLHQAARIIKQGNTRRMDLGRCNQRYFLNNSAAGLEPYVTRKQEKIGWIKGLPRYLVAAVQAILEKPEWHARLEWDGGLYEGRISLVSVGNGRRTGGVFFMTPSADPFDGRLTFAYGHRGTRLGLLRALPRAMKSGAGSYLEMEGMYEVHCTRLSITLDHPSPAHTDGELFPEQVRLLEYSILPDAVPVLMPQR